MSIALSNARRAVQAAHEAAVASVHGRLAVDDALDLAHEASGAINDAFNRTNLRADEDELQELRQELTDVFASLRFSTWGGPFWSAESQRLLGLEPRS